MCVSVSHIFRCYLEVWFIFDFLFPTSSFFSPHYAYRQHRQPSKAFEFVCVWVCMHASVNPFCQVLAQPFLSKLPAWSWSPLCWWEELEEKVCGTPAAPRPGPSSYTREGWAWDFLRAWALCGSCDWRFNRLSLGHPSATLHSLSHLGNGGEKDNYTHIQ